MANSAFFGKRRQTGAVLLVAMVFLLLLAMLAGTVMQTSVLEFHMAGNQQFKVEAFHRAQGIVSAVSDDIDNFIVTGEVGYKICYNGDTDATCDSTIINLSSDLQAALDTASAEYYITREGPLYKESMPIRLGEGNSSSATSYDFALFEVVADYKPADTRLGKAEIAQGVAVRILD